MRHCSDELRGFFTGLLRRFDRIVVTGPSGCGKSTLADEVQIDDRPIIHSDDFKRFALKDLPGSVRSSVVQTFPDGLVRVPHEAIEAAEKRGEQWPFTRMFDMAGASEEIVKACEQAGRKWVFEGVMGSRALRKAAQKGRPLCDAVVLLKKPRRAQKPGQISQGKAIMTVFNEWLELDRRRTPVFQIPEDA